MGLLPLLGGATAAYLASSLMMKTSIMTEKIARRRPEEGLRGREHRPPQKSITTEQVPPSREAPAAEP
jgi:hypothetical protein